VLTGLTSGLSPAVEDFFELDELAPQIPGGGGYLVFQAINSKTDLIALAALTKLLRTRRKIPTRVVVVNFTGDAKLTPLIAKLGIQDILDPAIPPKSLKLKLDLWQKGALAAVTAAPAATVATAAKKATGVVPKGPAPKEGLVWDEALQIEDDIWLIAGEADCINMMGRWLVKLTSAGPFAAQWEAVPGQSSIWRFTVAAEEAELLIPDNGSWYFRGEQKPDFEWQTNKWQMSGASFALFYNSPNGGVVPTKLRFENGVLHIARDSAYAKEKLSIFNMTFNKEVISKKKALAFGDDSVDSETEHLDSLAGKTEAGEDAATGGLTLKNPNQETPGALAGQLKRRPQLPAGMVDEDEKTSADDAATGAPLRGTIEEGGEKLPGALAGKPQEENTAQARKVSEKNGNDADEATRGNRPPPPGTPAAAAKAPSQADGDNEDPRTRERREREEKERVPGEELPAHLAKDREHGTRAAREVPARAEDKARDAKEHAERSARELQERMHELIEQGLHPSVAKERVLRERRDQLVKEREEREKTQAPGRADRTPTAPGDPRSAKERQAPVWKPWEAKPQDGDLSGDTETEAERLSGHYRKRAGREGAPDDAGTKDLSGKTKTAADRLGGHYRKRDPNAVPGKTLRPTEDEQPFEEGFAAVDSDNAADFPDDLPPEVLAGIEGPTPVRYHLNSELREGDQSWPCCLIDYDGTDVVLRLPPATQTVAPGAVINLILSSPRDVLTFQLRGKLTDPGWPYLHCRLDAPSQVTMAEFLTEFARLQAWINAWLKLVRGT
jgi:hypothetical protein